MLTACTVGVALLAAGATSGGAKAATGRKTLTIYSVATVAQFINHQDDRIRALKNSPLNASQSKLVPKTQAGSGPYPGDTVLYSFNLFTSASLKQRAGSAVYTCRYNFEKHALCTVYYLLKGGSTLLGAGPVDFTSTSFTLALTGGTKNYLGADGQVSMSPLEKNLQRLSFILLPS